MDDQWDTAVGCQFGQSRVEFVEPAALTAAEEERILMALWDAARSILLYLQRLNKGKSSEKIGVKNR